MTQRRAELEQWLHERRPTRIELRDFEELMQRLAPIEESALRRLLRELDVPLDPLVAGVDQKDYHALRHTLLALAGAYDRGGAETKRLVRSIVITAKDHARLAAKNQRLDVDRRAMKQEMVDWMLVWLENPGVFPLWIALRSELLGLDCPPVNSP